MIEIVTKGDMTTYSAIKNRTLRLIKAIDQATAQEAHLLRKEMVEGYTSQSPGGKKIQPLAASTIRLRRIPTAGSKAAAAGKRVRGKTKALIVTGDLRNSVSVQGGRGNYTVGVHRGARGKRSGKDMVSIAEIHEYGTRAYTQVVTEKMRRFSFVLVKFGVIKAPWTVGQTLKKRIPARPVLNPSHKAWELNAKDRFETRLMYLVGAK